MTPVPRSPAAYGHNLAACGAGLVRVRRGRCLECTNARVL